MFISSCCNKYLIEFLKSREIKQIKSTSLTGLPAIPGFEATEHLRIIMRKKFAENVFNNDQTGFMKERYIDEYVRIILDTIAYLNKQNKAG